MLLKICNLRLACESLDHFMEDSDDFAQIQVKDESDWWVVLKKMNERFLILFLSQTPQSTIVEIQDTVTNILKTYFSNMFII